MSRVGKKPIVIPKGVQVDIQGKVVSIKGPKGSLNFVVPSLVEAKKEGEAILVIRKEDTQESRSRHGLVRNILQNIVTGVTQGFVKSMEIKGVGYRATVKGKILEISLGYSHPIHFTIPEGIEIKVTNQTRIDVHGADRVLVGQVAANLRTLRPPEPYQGKGVRYVDEVIRRKVGKAAAGAQGA